MIVESVSVCEFQESHLLHKVQREVDRLEEELLYIVQKSLTVLNSCHLYRFVTESAAVTCTVL